MITFTSGVSHRRENAVESCDQPHPSPRESVEKTVSVLIFEASFLYLPGSMICMGHSDPNLAVCRPGRYENEAKTYYIHLQGTSAARRTSVWAKATLRTTPKSPWTRL